VLASTSAAVNGGVREFCAPVAGLARHPSQPALRRVGKPYTACQCGPRLVVMVPQCRKPLAPSSA
jgi:hypothetical protein